VLASVLLLSYPSLLGFGLYFGVFTFEEIFVRALDFHEGAVLALVAILLDRWVNRSER